MRSKTGGCVETEKKNLLYAKDVFPNHKYLAGTSHKATKARNVNLRISFYVLRVVTVVSLLGL